VFFRVYEFTCSHVFTQTIMHAHASLCKRDLSNTDAAWSKKMDAFLAVLFVNVGSFIVPIESLRHNGGG